MQLCAMILAETLVTSLVNCVWILECAFPNTPVTVCVDCIQMSLVSKIAAKKIKHLLKDTKMILDVRLASANARI